MSDIPAYRSDDIPAAAPAPVFAATPRPVSDVVVEVADASRLAELDAAWTDLVDRTDSPNVFMTPALARAAAAAEPAARYVTLLAWKPSDGGKRLVGLWAFAVGHAPRCMLPIRTLTAPRARHGHELPSRTGLSRTPPRG